VDAAGRLLFSGDDYFAGPNQLVRRVSAEGTIVFSGTSDPADRAVWDEERRMLIFDFPHHFEAVRIASVSDEYGRCSDPIVPKPSGSHWTAETTAEIIAEPLGLPVLTDIRLREMHCGEGVCEKSHRPWNCRSVHRDLRGDSLL